MPRTARIVIPDVPYHITQRGNNRQDVFFVDDDRRVYLELLSDYARALGLDVLGYCLMSSHVHLVAVPRTGTSLAQAIGRADHRYARYINRLHGRQGHLWQERFYSCALDEKHAVAAMRYVEQNPVRAGVTRVPWTYPWSSAAAHVGEGDKWGLLDLKSWRADWSSEEWKKMLRTSIDETLVASIRRNTAHCCPLGSDSFVSKIETRLGRRLRPSPVGRPKGWRKSI